MQKFLVFSWGFVCYYLDILGFYPVISICKKRGNIETNPRSPSDVSSAGTSRTRRFAKSAAKKSFAEKCLGAIRAGLVPSSTPVR